MSHGRSRGPAPDKSLRDHLRVVHDRYCARVPPADAGRSDGLRREAYAALRGANSTASAAYMDVGRWDRDTARGWVPNASIRNEPYRCEWGAVVGGRIRRLRR